ncbi:MAG TPA: nucleotide exchange factor GrpE [Candidatus Paceibacterota bacterium]
MAEEFSPSTSSGQENNQSESEIERLKVEREEYLNGWKRAKADLINYKKEEEETIGKAIKYGNEGIIRETINILDSFDLAISSIKDVEIAKGFEVIKNQLEGAMAKYGLRNIEIKQGDKFDPQYHEAIGMVDQKDNLVSGDIAEEVSRGYMIYDKVVRATKVLVIK